MGSVIGRINQQGNAVSNYSYEAFGAITSQTGQLGNAYTYMGQAYDSSTGLYYFNARWYDSSIGRFISADPLPGNPFQSGSTNRYAYALDNPITYEDVSGLKSMRAAQASNTMKDPPPFNWGGFAGWFVTLLAAIVAFMLLPTIFAVVTTWGFSLVAIGAAILTMTAWEFIALILIVVIAIIAIVFLVSLIVEWLLPRLQSDPQPTPVNSAPFYLPMPVKTSP